VLTSAVLHDSLGDYVYVLDVDPSGKNYRARRQSVVVGAEDGAHRSILSGLEEGAKVATNGAFKLRSGLLVYVTERQSDLETDRSQS